MFLCLPVLIFVRSSILVFFYHFSILLGRFCSVLLQLYYFVTLSICSSRPPFYFFSLFSYGSPVFVSFFIFATMLDCSSVHLFFCSSNPPSFFFMLLPGSFLFFYKCLICSSVPPVLFCKSLSFVSFNLPFFVLLLRRYFISSVPLLCSSSPPSFIFYCSFTVHFPLFPCSSVLQVRHPSFCIVLLQRYLVILCPCSAALHVPSFTLSLFFATISVLFPCVPLFFCPPTFIFLLFFNSDITFVFYSSVLLSSRSSILIFLFFFLFFATTSG